MASTIELSVIVVLTIVVIICIIAVCLLIRWLKKVTAKDDELDGFPDDSSVNSSEVDMSIFAPSTVPPDTPFAAGARDRLEGEEFEDWNALFLPPAKTKPKAKAKRLKSVPPKEGFMFEMEVEAAGLGGVREIRTLFIPHVDHLGDLGLVVSGDAPVTIFKVDRGSAADRAGARGGDELISINNTPCSRSRHQEVVDLFTLVITKAQVAQSTVIGGGKQYSHWSANQHDNEGFGGFDESSLSLPGQMVSSMPKTPPSTARKKTQPPPTVRKPGTDPYAPIREAASRHQVEAARLMQAENFKEARVLLDRAIELLHSIPQQHGGSGPNKPSAGEATTLRRNRRVKAGFRPPRGGAKPPIRSRPLRFTGRGKAKPELGRVTLINAVSQLPDMGFRPIRSHRLSLRRPSGVQSTVSNVSGYRSTDPMIPPATNSKGKPRQMAW